MGKKINVAPRNHKTGFFMKTSLFFVLKIKPILLFLILFGSMAFVTISHSETNDLFTDLRGNWGGGGTMTLKDGKKQRLVCDAKYTGSASQLRLVINCKSSSNQIRMNASLSANSGRLLGTWEEKTYKALGTISGVATDNRIKFYIGGNVLGTMNVRYSKTRQDVSIKTATISLQDVRLKLKRR